MVRSSKIEAKLLYKISKPWFRHEVSWGLVLLCMMLHLGSGCNRGEITAEAEAADGATGGASSTTPVPNDESNEAAAADDGPLVAEVPDGTAEELFEFMAEMEVKELGAQPESEEAEDAAVAQGAKIRRLMRTRIAACDKIMAKEVPEDTRFRALGIKLDALRTLAALDPEAVGPAYQAFLDQMLKSGNPYMERMAKSTRYQGQVYDFISFDQETPEKILDELRQLLADPEAGPETLSATRDAMGWVLQDGQIDTSAAGFRLIGERFQSHANEDVSAEGRSLLSQAIQIELQQQMRLIDEKKEGAIEGLLGKLAELLKPEKPNENAVGFAAQTAQYLEYVGYAPEALRAYEMILKRFENDADADLVSKLTRTVSLARRRLQLIGQPLQLDGVTLRGDAFDWATYRGKWVLVVFWTTWQVNAVEGIDQIRETVRTYQDPAVEVVLVNLDDDRNVLERFLKEHPMGWKVLVQPDPNAAGFENPNSIRCGVESVPFVLLAGPDGKVVDINLLGDRLKQVLDEKVKP